MMQDVLNALGADRYMQHAICLTNDPSMLLLYISGDLVTAWSYFTIGAVLFLSGAPPSNLRPSMKLLFGAFIALCGLSHLTETLTLFWGIYRLDVMVTAAMAGVSATTAIITVRDAVART